jgi:hypothetical protein
MTETIISGVIVACIGVTMASMAFTLAVWAWQVYKELRDERKDKL